MTERYEPIACAVYDVLEVAAMKQRRLTLTIDGKEQDILARDVYARGTEEFLDGIDPATGATLHLRLDRIERLYDHAENKTFIPKQC